MADLPIAEFNVSDGFTPQQINKLNSNFRSISNKILEAISMTGEASNKTNNTLNIISNAFDIMNGFLPLTGGDMTGSIRQKISTVTRGTTPSTTVYRTYEFIDSADKRLSQLEASMNTSGQNRLHLYVLGNHTTSDQYGGIIIQKSNGNTGNTNLIYDANTGQLSGINKLTFRTQLYNNTSGSNGTITLSASAANYNHIRIYFYGKSKASSALVRYDSVDVYSPNGKGAQLSVTGQTVSGIQQVVFHTRFVTISGSSITNTSYCSASIDGAGTTCNKNNEVYITRVEGWNE